MTDAGPETRKLEKREADTDRAVGKAVRWAVGIASGAGLTSAGYGLGRNSGPDAKDFERQGVQIAAVSDKLDVLNAKLEAHNLAVARNDARNDEWRRTVEEWKRAFAEQLRDGERRIRDLERGHVNGRKE